MVTVKQRTKNLNISLDNFFLVMGKGSKYFVPYEKFLPYIRLKKKKRNARGGGVFLRKNQMESENEGGGGDFVS